MRGLRLAWGNVGRALASAAGLAIAAGRWATLLIALCLKRVPRCASDITTWWWSPNGYNLMEKKRVIEELSSSSLTSRANKSIKILLKTFRDCKIGVPSFIRGCITVSLWRAYSTNSLSCKDSSAYTKVQQLSPRSWHCIGPHLIGTVWSSPFAQKSMSFHSSSSIFDGCFSTLSRALWALFWISDIDDISVGKIIYWIPGDI